MAKSKDDIKSEDETLRVAYKSGTPLEGGKIADSEQVDLFSAAHNIANQQQQNKGVIAESKPVDLYSAARGVAKANNKADESTANCNQPSAN